MIYLMKTPILAILGYFWPVFCLFLVIYSSCKAAICLSTVYSLQFLLRLPKKRNQVITVYSKWPKSAFLPQKLQNNGFLKGWPKKYFEMEARFVFSTEKYVRMVKFQNFLAIFTLHFSFRC